MKLAPKFLAVTGLGVAAAVAMIACKSTTPQNADSALKSDTGPKIDVSSLKLYLITNPAEKGANLTDSTENSASAGLIAVGEVTEAGGYPDPPRKSAFHDISFKNEQTLYFGISGNFLSIVEVASTLNLSMGMLINRQLLLVKNTPNNEDLTYVGSDGFVKLKLDDGRKFGASCTYETSATETMLWANSVKAAGSGAGNNMTLSQATKVSLVSEFFPVPPGSTVATLMNVCHDIYATRVEKALKGELQRQIMAKTQYEESSPTAEKMAIRAALWGPRVDRVKLYEHHWNVKVADIKSTGQGKVTVKGRIDHSVNVQLDDYVDYTCESDNLVEKTKDIQFKQRSAITGWRDSAKKIVELICNDAYVQFRNTKYTQVGGKEVDE